MMSNQLMSPTMDQARKVAQSRCTRESPCTSLKTVLGELHHVSVISCQCLFSASRQVIMPVHSVT